MEQPHPELEHFTELGLKHKSEAQLVDGLVEVATDWSQEQQQQLLLAYRIAKIAHRDDKHKQMPYVYHVLRVANRLTGYLHVRDPDVIMAALLHDIVEDHATELINGSLFSAQPISELATYVSPSEQQELALVLVEALFNTHVARLVGAMSNSPDDQKPHSYEERLRQYVSKIKQEIVDPYVWCLKFSDWCDNGVGITHDVEGQGTRHFHFKRKYSSVLPVLMSRFYRDDIQAMLDEPAKAYARHRFALGHARLT